jgi:hypothetical protein
MPENAARVSAIESGSVDLVWNLPLESIDKLKENKNLTVDEVPTSTWDGIVMGNKTKPFDDVACAARCCSRWTRRSWRSSRCSATACRRTRPFRRTIRTSTSS